MTKEQIEKFYDLERRLKGLETFKLLITEMVNRNNFELSIEVKGYGQIINTGRFPANFMWASLAKEDTDTILETVDKQIIDLKLQIEKL